MTCPEIFAVVIMFTVYKSIELMSICITFNVYCKTLITYRKFGCFIFVDKHTLATMIDTHLIVRAGYIILVTILVTTNYEKYALRINIVN